jgi:hypothetical protein
MSFVCFTALSAKTNDGPYLILLVTKYSVNDTLVMRGTHCTGNASHTPNPGNFIKNEFGAQVIVNYSTVEILNDYTCY